jgi:ADP-ribosylglycohydrolase
MHPLIDTIRQAVEADILSMIDDGHDAEALGAELKQAAAKGSADALLEFQQDLWNRPSPAGFGYEEPNDWESISRTFPDAQSHERFGGSEADLADRIHGGWLGRVIGCQLGKPMEGAWPDACEKALRQCDSWPLTDYMKPIEDPQRLAALKDSDEIGKRLYNWQWLARGRFGAGAVDDDTTYSMVGLRVLEKYGVGFTTDQYIAEFTAVTPRCQIFASGANMFVRGLWGLKAPFTATYGNPCRQSLGAMIRCDPFGWSAPAHPALAARMAFQDARGSQTRNGIYTGIFFAVLMADTFSHGDPVRAVATARKYVPPKSRFAEMVDFTVDLCRKTDDWQQANAEIYARYDKGLKRSPSLHMNHCLPNAAITLMSLIFAKGVSGESFGRAICLATMAGMDTDCNAATAGSIMGIALGAEGIPPRWSDPLHDTVQSHLVDMRTNKISDLARRTFLIAKEGCRWAG